MKYAFSVKTLCLSSFSVYNRQSSACDDVITNNSNRKLRAFVNLIQGTYYGIIRNGFRSKLFNCSLDFYCVF